MTVPTLADVEYLEGDLLIPDGLPYEAWVELGEQLQFRERNVGWWLGAWWLHGEHHYGQAASQAAPTGYAAKTCQNAARVVERIEPARRREDVPFSYHEAVAVLTDPRQQDELLAEAARGGMERHELRAKVRHLRAVDDPPPDAKTWQFACMTCGDTGPHLDCQAGHTRLDPGAICSWLGDHEEHVVRVLSEAQVVTWRAVS